MKYDKYDPMSQFKSRPTAKIITQIELDNRRLKLEDTHKVNFSKWMNNEHSEVRYRCDIQSDGYLSKAMQAKKKIIDPWKGWPDIAIYLKMGSYCGLQIELKREDSGLWLRDGSMSQAKHTQQQNEMHIFLRSLGWKVSFAEGAEEAKRIFLEYVK